MENITQIKLTRSWNYSIYTILLSWHSQNGGGGELAFKSSTNYICFYLKHFYPIQNVVDHYIYDRRRKYKWISHPEFCKKLRALYSVDALCQEIGGYQLSWNVHIKPRYEVNIITNKYSLAVEKTKELLTSRMFTI